MYNPLSKLVLMISLLVALVGQTMAFDFVGSKVSASIIEAAEHQTVALSDGNLSTDTDDCCDTQCCENDCICPDNACTTFVFITLRLNVPYRLHTHDLDIGLTHRYTGRHVPPLERPPILPSPLIPI